MLYQIVNLLFFSTTLLIGTGISSAKPVSVKSMIVQVNDGMLSFQSPGMKLNGGRAGVELRVGNKNEHFLWMPEGKGKSSTNSHQTPAGKAMNRTLRWIHTDGYEHRWTICTLKEEPGFTIRSTFTNRSKQPVNLQNFILCRTPVNGLICEDDPSSWWLSAVGFYSRQFGHLKEILMSEKELSISSAEFPNVYPPSGFYGGRTSPRDGARWRSYRDAFTLYTDNGFCGITMGAVGPPVSYVDFHCYVDNGILMLDIISSMDGVVVDPGESRESEQVLVLARPYRESMQTMFRWIAATHGSRTQRGPLLGWCSWYDRGSGINAEVVHAVADAITRFHDRIPMDVMQIDQGWEVKYGDWRPNERFPDGMAYTADRIKAAGAIPGIWMTMVSSKDRKPDDWYIGSPASERLDVTNPDVEAWIRESVGRLYKAGYRYYKFDFNAVSGGGDIHNPKLTTLQVMRHLYTILREAAGEDSYILTCVGIDRGTVGLVDAARIGADAVGEWKPAPLADGLPKNPMNRFESIRSIALSALANGILYTNDPDCTNTLPPIVVVDTFVDLTGKGKRKINWDETITFHSFVGLLGGLTLTSEPFNTPPYNEKTSLRMMEILNPPAPDKGWALYGGTDPMNHHFGFLAKRNWGNFASLILFNPEDKSSDVALNTALLKEIGECFHVWSFWEEKYLGIGDATFVAKNLPPHGSKVLRLTQLPERDDFPVLVGSNLHISMGSSEIRTLSSNPNGMTIELTDAGAREGKLFIHSKKPLILEKSTGCNSFIVPEKNNIYIIVLTDRQRGISQVISIKTSDMTQKESVEVLKDAKLLARFYSAGFDFLK